MTLLYLKLSIRRRFHKEKEKYRQVISNYTWEIVELFGKHKLISNT